MYGDSEPVVEESCDEEQHSLGVQFQSQSTLIDNDMHQEKPGSVMELLLDTNGICFLCHIDISPKDNPSATVGGTCLRNICRYLNINPNSVFQKGMQNHPELEEDVSLQLKHVRCNFSVNLCSSCHSLTTKLTSLIQELEMVKMLLHNQLQMFHKVMPGSGSNLNPVTEFEAGELDEHVVKLLQQEMKGKCAKRLDILRASVLPRVQVSRITPPNLETDKIDTETDNDTNQLIAPPEFVTSEKIDSDYMKKLYHHILKERGSGLINGKRYQCVFCGVTRNISKIRVHLTSSHPEQLLAFAKHAAVSTQNFQTCCHHTMSQLVNECEKIITQESQFYRSYKVNCFLCDKTGIDIQYIGYHLMLKHVDAVTKKLNDLQKSNETFPEIKKKEAASYVDVPVARIGKCKVGKAVKQVKLVTSKTENVTTVPCSVRRRPLPHNIKALHRLGASKTDMKQRFLYVLKKVGSGLLPGGSNRYECAFCGKVYTISKIRTHLTNLHPEKLLDFAKLSTVTDATFQNYCHQVLQSEADKCPKSFSNERIRHGKKRADVPLKLTKSYYVKFTCTICNVNGNDVQYLGYHLMLDHANVLRDKLKVLQESNAPLVDPSAFPISLNLVPRRNEVTSDINVVTKRNKRRVTETNTSPKEKRGRKKKSLVFQNPVDCLHCGQLFTEPHKLQIHSVKRHLEQNFISCKPNNMAYPEFVKNCQEFLREEQKLCKRRTVGEVTLLTCMYCKVSIRDYTTLSVHLVFRHRRVLMKKLEDTFPPPAFSTPVVKVELARGLVTGKEEMDQQHPIDFLIEHDHLDAVNNLVLQEEDEDVTEETMEYPIDLGHLENGGIENDQSDVNDPIFISADLDDDDGTGAGCGINYAIEKTPLIVKLERNCNNFSSASEERESSS